MPFNTIGFSPLPIQRESKSIFKGLLCGSDDWTKAHIGGRVAFVRDWVQVLTSILEVSSLPNASGSITQFSGIEPTEPSIPLHANLLRVIERAIRLGSDTEILSWSSRRFLERQVQFC